MGDFSSLSDTDESAVEQILAEAMDHCVLQQVAAINCSSFTHSVLPSHLESRFQRLKTFPSSSSKPLPKPQLAPDSANELKNSVNEPKAEKKPVLDDSGNSPEKEMNSHGKFRSGYQSSPSVSSNSSSGYLNSPNFRAKKADAKGKYGKFQSGSMSFRSNSSNSTTKTARIGCFWCSQKRASKKKSGNRNVVSELDGDGGKNDEILSDLKSFSTKKQKKLMKIAKKEEEKINKEAEKIVKWAKQASARLDFSAIVDDDDNGHNFSLR